MSAGKQTARALTLMANMIETQLESEREGSSLHAEARAVRALAAVFRLKPARLRKLAARAAAEAERGAE